METTAPKSMSRVSDGTGNTLRSKEGMMMSIALKADSLSVRNTLAALAIGVAAGAAAVWAREKTDAWLSSHASEKAIAQTAAARPDGELPGEYIVSKLEQALNLALSDEDHAAAGEIVQYALAIAPVIGYALFRDKLPGRGVARGAMFGEAMFVAQDQLLNTVIGLNGNLSAYPWTAHARGAVAHAAYGVVAELAVTLLESGAQQLGAEHWAPARERADAHMLAHVSSLQIGQRRESDRALQ